MNKPLDSTHSENQPSIVTRRSFLRRAGIGAGVAAMAPALMQALATPTAQAATTTKSVKQDIAILNFALNLEYLEGDFYTYATEGKDITAFGIAVDGSGSAGASTVKTTGSTLVPFVTPIIAQYAAEIARDERAHVRTLRNAVTALGGTPVSRPKINLVDSFNTLASAAGIGSAFDPFADETSFLLGAFIFEDVGVTAYKGAAALISNPNILTAAAGFLSVESYHAAEVRTVLLRMSQTNAAIPGIVEQISSLRRALSGANDDQGILFDNLANVVPTDDNGLTYSRTTDQILRIVYGNTAKSPGLFFPSGLNGDIR
ncbi:MAG: ferritin-like domain-containing protein [Verrucomicrobia bacterium]|nr:ferritin-like domain-containing protein [Verrucomicrobiota bacterium]